MIKGIKENKMNQATLEERTKDLLLANAQIKRDIKKLVEITKFLDTASEVTLNNYEEFDAKVEALVEELEIVELI
jgi:hypothetical protein